MAANTYSPKECGKNKYGADCTAWCSQKKTFCQNMLFCTYSNGCSCAAGYTGPLCNKECTEGTYGRRCKKICSNNCKTQCDNILGTCKGGCKNNFIMPYCIEKYPVLIEPPKLDFSDFHSINLVLNLLNENIFGSKSKIPSFYQIVYKPISSELDFQYSSIKPINTFLLKDKISNLVAATMYTVGVILIAEDGNSNKDDINTANYFTKCF
ncbi:cell death abnormality protein 1-like, partial [Daktulosphaira vitifoliae]|uniref:cell death abnormality protein 1-like n=1 Tax=Daktulosphaira vitifoliae TaxID=58002 RepID=UPI0021AAA0FD